MCASAAAASESVGVGGCAAVAAVAPAAAGAAGAAGAAVPVAGAVTAASASRGPLPHEAACASGSVAVLAATAGLEAGRYDVALVVGADGVHSIVREVQT